MAASAPAAQRDFADVEAVKKLGENAQEVVVDGQDLSKVLAYLQDISGVKIQPDWAALQAAGVDEHSPVTLSLREVPFHKVISLVLQDVSLPGGAAGTSLGFCVEKGVVKISTLDRLAAEPAVVRTYDVHELLAPVALPGVFPQAPIPEDMANGFRAQRVRDLAQVIESTVAPESWKFIGGKVGDIREDNGQLTVTQTPLQQEQVAELLEQLGDARNAHSQTLPYRDVMDAPPPNWAEMQAASDKTRKKLSETLVLLVTDRADLEKTVNYLRDNMEVNVFVDWPALQDAGVDRNSPVTVNLKNQTYGDALSEILKAADGKKELGFIIDDGIVTVSTKDELRSARYAVVGVFDVRDLLEVKPAVTQTGAGDHAADADRAAKIKGITQVIEKKVAPGSWRDGGGTLGSIRELNGTLIIRQLPDNQQAIEDVLAGMRKERGLTQGAAASSPASATKPAFGTSPATQGAGTQPGASDTRTIQQRVIAEFREAQRESGEALSKGDFQRAVDYAEQAVNLVDANRRYFSEVEGVALHDAAAARLEAAQVTRANTGAFPVDAGTNGGNSLDAQAAALVRQARRQFEAGRDVEAEDLLNRALALNPRDETAGRVLLRMRTGTLDRAPFDLVERSPKAEADALPPGFLGDAPRGSVESIVADARQRYASGKPEEAQALLQKAAVLNPEDVSAKLLLRLTQDGLADRQYQRVRDGAAAGSDSAPATAPGH